MIDTMKKTVAVCAAASSFAGGAYIVASQVSTMVDARVVAVMAAQAQLNSSAVK